MCVLVIGCNCCVEAAQLAESAVCSCALAVRLFRAPTDALLLSPHALTAETSVDVEHFLTACPLHDDRFSLRHQALAGADEQEIVLSHFERVPASASR